MKVCDKCREITHDYHVILKDYTYLCESCFNDTYTEPEGKAMYNNDEQYYTEADSTIFDDVEFLTESVPGVRTLDDHRYKIWCEGNNVFITIYKNGVLYREWVRDIDEIIDIETLDKMVLKL